MLTFETILLFTVLLFIPVIIACWNMLQPRHNMFLQMMLGYIGCYFMKNFYTLLSAYTVTLQVPLPPLFFQ